MKVLFVNPPNGFIDRTYLAPPLGLLTLAAVVQQHGWLADVLDLNLEVLADPALGNHSTFYEAACARIIEQNPDVVGFTSMCLESHVSLELARQIKKALPEVVTVFGGTHFGAIALEVLENFPFADYVVRGEAEYALPAILHHRFDGASSLPRNVFYRDKDEILSGAADEVSVCLEELPFPAYDLADLQRYFTLNPARLMNYEAGRGCVFKCSFCYSPFHYGEAVRNKNPEKVVEDLRKLFDLGARHIFFVQDNLLNSARWASELCLKIAAAKLPLTWECYVTYPQLKEPLIDLLAEAGCKGVFTGIDAVDVESQQRLNKPFLRDWETISQKLAYCLKRGIQPLCAFILEEPEQDQRKNDAVIYTALRCLHLGCEIHLNTLSLYNRTSLGITNSSARFSYSSAKVKLLMDAPEVVQVNNLAKHLPYMFPYHSTNSDANAWEVFVAKVHTLSSLLSGLRRTLYHYVVEQGNSIWRSLDYIDAAFLDWMERMYPDERREASVLEFNRHFAYQNITQETRILLGTEVAIMILSKSRPDRQVSLDIDWTAKTYYLARFIDIQSLQDANSQVPWQATSRGVKAPPLNLSWPPDERTFAMLSQRKTIKVFFTSPEFAELLLRLDSASASGETVRLSASEVEWLAQDGWIWLKETGASGSNPLDNSPPNL